MKKIIYDVAILGSGLSALTSLLKILEEDANLKICVLSSNKDSNIKTYSKKDINYLKKYHSKIFRNIKFDQIDSQVLRSSKKNKTSFIQTYNFGGLGSFWGGGYFPLKNKNKYLDEFQDFFENNFKVLNLEKRNGTKKLNIKTNFFEIVERDPKFLINKFDNKNKNEILDPGKEIKALSKKYKFKVFDNISLKNFIFSKRNNFYSLISENKNIIYARNILVGLGVFNTPLFLNESSLINEDYIQISEHRMYRIPFINLKNTKSRLSISNKINRECFSKFRRILSLREAFLFKFLKRFIFVGIYFFPKDFFKEINFLNNLCNGDILGFSQIYLGNDYKNSTCKISLKQNKLEQKIVSLSKLNLGEILFIFIFFLSNFLIPIPYKYSLRFGSSYHFYGSLKNKKIDFDKIKKMKSIQVIDSSTIENIGAEPSSFLVIRNSYLRTKLILNNLKN